MVNVCVFRRDVTTPSGWTEVPALLQNRLILADGTPLDTGGSDTHTHSLTGTSVSTWSSHMTYVWVATGGGALYGAQNHTHSISSSSSTSESNLPSYKNHRMVYRSMTGWDGKIPAGSVIFREEVPTGYSRVDAGESYFIRIAGTAGGTGGSDSHNHTCSVTLANWTGAAARWPRVSAPTLSVINGIHGHNSANGLSGSTTYDYKYWGCGLISADSEEEVVINSYLLFDNTPSETQWEVVTATGRYLKCLSTYTVATGGTNTTLTHTHTLSMTSNTSNNCNSADAGTNATGDYCSHTHTITASLGSQEIQPPFVVFVLARAKVNLGTKIRSFFVSTFGA